MVSQPEKSSGESTEKNDVLKPKHESALNGEKGKNANDASPAALDTERKARIRVKNRRKMYLDSHPSYFESPDLELADPLLYDRCVRRFQSAAEREAEGRSRGYSGVLEADLYRSEAKLAALAGHPFEAEPSGMISGKAADDLAYVPGPDGQVLPEDEDEVPKTKEEGMERWKEAMTLRFLQGRDPDFSYEDVDENEEWDVIERQDAEEQWFEDEEPEWTGEDAKGNGKHGETGIQDF